MKKGKKLTKIMQKYSLKHGDLIDINTLRFISSKEKMELNDLITILGISPNSKYNIMKNSLSKAKIIFYSEKELQEIQIMLNDDIQGIDRLSLKNIEKLCSKYQINICNLCRFLKISKDQIFRLRKGQKYILLKSQYNEKKVMNDLFIKEFKYQNFITKAQLEYSKQKFNLYEESKICTLLNVQKTSYRRLLSEKTKTMKIDLVNKSEKIYIEQQIIEKYTGLSYITKQDIEDLKYNLHATDQIIKDTLSISTNSFRKIMKNEIKRTRIILHETKLKLHYLMMDIKYIHGEGFYTNKELKKMCKNYNIPFDDLLKNISIKGYLYLKKALKENKKGIYIGNEHPISHTFIEKYSLRIENLCKKITNRYCYSSYLYTEKQDIAQEAFILLQQKCGNIEKNFSYNEELLFNMLASKVKYFVISKRNKRYEEILLDNFDSYSNNYDEYSVFNSSFTPSLDNKISLLHQYIIKIFNENNDYIYHNRVNAYKIISYKLKISIKKLKKIVQEIKEFYLESGFAKECLDGSIIDMTNSDNF